MKGNSFFSIKEILEINTCQVKKGTVSLWREVMIFKWTSH